MPRPRLPNLSLIQLTLLGFLLAILPLGLLVYQASNAFRELSTQASLSTHEAVAFTRRAQTLASLALDMERTARQYQIMQSPALLELLHNQQKNFARLLQQEFILFPALEAKQELKALLLWMEGQPIEEAATFTQLASLTGQLQSQTRETVDQHLGRFEQQVSELQQQLAWQLAILGSLSLLLVSFFTWRLLKPLGYLEKRIASLVKLQAPSTFKRLRRGPAELIKLDVRLNWLEQQLHALEEQKQQFLRHMSHELKTPLASIREATDLLQEEVLGELNPQQQQVTELLDENTRALQKLIEQLLNYNRLQLQQTPNLQPTWLNSLLDQVLAPYQLLFKQQRLQIQQQGTEIRIQTDGSYLQQVLDNLISNALHYGDNQRPLHIRAGQKNDGFWIEVENSGPGIPEEEQEHLFEVFYQGKSRRKGSIKGSGIGLSLAKDAMQALGGELTLKYSRQGATCFLLRWPAAPSSTPG